MEDVSGIAALRHRLGLSLREVESITKGRVSNAYLSQLETGKVSNPSIGVASELAATYGIPVEALIELLGQRSTTISPPKCPTCGQVIKDAHLQQEQSR